MRITWTALGTHLAFAVFLFLISAGICWIMARKVRIMDMPNERSSHEIPIPKSGGVAIVTTFLIGVAMIFWIADVTMIDHRLFFTFVFCALLVAGISFYDDIRGSNFVIKLGCHILAAVLVMALGLVIHRLTIFWHSHISLGAFGYVITFLWIVGLTNAFNFMDGINGLAGGTAILTASFFGIICFSQGSLFVYIICYTLISGTLGFFVFNFPKPRLFMGDVGSAFLGFVFATLAIIAALYDRSHTSLLVMPMLLFHFIYDTFFTFFRRLIKGENVFMAHREHLYQLFSRLVLSHGKVSVFYFAVNIAQGIGAWIMVSIPTGSRVFVFLPFLIFQVFYTLVIIRKARAARFI